jgi:hypothetical protein
MSPNMPRAIVDLDSFKESHNIMLFGDTGSGKTAQIATLPGKVLILASESTIMLVVKKQVERMGLDWDKEKKRFKIWRIKSWQDLEDAYIWLRDNQTAFDWVVIDSATSVQTRAMRAAMEAAVKRNPEKRDIDLPDRGEHQKMQNAMKRMIVDFNELDCNVLWFAQAMRREDQDGNEIVVPFIMGKDYEVSSFACAQMTAFGYYLKKKAKGSKGRTDRVLIWESFADPESDINYWSKDRYDVFPKVCIMAEGAEQKTTMGDLIAMIDSAALERAVLRINESDDDAEPRKPVKARPIKRAARPVRRK